MNDLISRQTLQDAMYHEAFEVDSDMQKWDGGCWIRYKLFENVVDALPSAQPEQRWIPCSERLPKYNKTVLVCVKQEGKEKKVFTAELRRRVKTPDIFSVCAGNDGWWDYRIGAWDSHEVLAWMPLPEPYRKEGGEK